jgi:hypothetical protein
MNKASLIVLSVVMVLAALGLGGGVGVLYQTQKDAPQISRATELVKKLTSKALPSIVAYGQIINIEGKNLKLSFNGEDVTVKISDTAAVTSFNTDSQGKTSQQNLDFSQVKLGQTVSINTRVLLDGQLQGEAIMIFSSPK